MATVLVTGGRERLGACFAEAFHEAGHEVLIQSRRPPPPEKRGARFLYFQSELDSADAVHALADQVQERAPSWDSVVLSASLFGFDNARKATEEDLESHFRVNAQAPIVLMQRLCRWVEARVGEAEPPRGTAPTSTSPNGTAPIGTTPIGTAPIGAAPIGTAIVMLDAKCFALNADGLSYTLSKSALHAAVRAMARPLAPALRVYGLAPGLSLKPDSLALADFARALELVVPSRCAVTPMALADMALFCLSGALQSGEVLIADGGLHLLRLPHDAPRTARKLESRLAGPELEASPVRPTP